MSLLDDIIDPTHQFVFRALDSSAKPHSSGDWQHGRKSAVCGAQELPEECSPHAAPRTAQGGSLLESQYRARIYAYERLIEQLYDLMPDRCDDAYDLVRSEYLAIHGPRD